LLLPYHNLKINHWNPGAQKPLILPVLVICNTSDEQIYQNIKTNSHARGNWLKAEPAHDGVAILCGSGPSLGDELENVRALQAAGGKVFALNGAAAFLYTNGIHADYQVILDARPETAQLIGPAKKHLFASQVSPELFARVPLAQLWQLQVETIDDLLPEYDEAYCLIGGAASVGNTTTCLAYAMGFRDLHCFGYDSSHRDGEGHAFAQPMNDGDPCAIVNFNGKAYTASLTMKLQAEKFQETARELKQLGCTITVHGSGLLPDIYNTPKEVLTEEQKYRRMWAIDGYRNHAPGEECAALFLEVAKPSGLVIDFGCGTGRGALKIKEAGCDVLLVDFADNCRDPEAQSLPFMLADLTKPMSGLRARYGYCTDVMEHIPTADVGAVIDNIMACVDAAFFQISTVPDYCGACINQDLHLTVKPHGWWRQLFIDRGYSVAWDQEQAITANFLVRRNSGQ
jgi:hypothetical protein